MRVGGGNGVGEMGACQSRQGALSTVIIGAEKIFGSGVEKPACGGDERAGSACYG